MGKHACCSNDPTPPAAKRPCPACGHTGRRVPEETPAALVRPEAAGRVAPGVRYRFCATAGCPVVYYPEAGEAAPVEAAALRVPVGQK
ncbi:MAG: (2Fe-2S)-binding protein, partial [Nitrospirae bacterium]